MLRNTLVTSKSLKNERTSRQFYRRADLAIKESEKSGRNVMTNRRIVQISKQESVEKDDESGNDSVLNISLNGDDDSTTGRQYDAQ